MERGVALQLQIGHAAGGQAHAASLRAAVALGHADEPAKLASDDCRLAGVYSPDTCGSRGPPPMWTTEW